MPRRGTTRSTTARRRRWAGALAVVAVATTGLAVVDDRPADAVLVSSSFDPAPRTYGGITVIGDSVLQGSVLFGPTIGDQLASLGWGPIRVRAGAAYSTGAFPVITELRSSYWIQRWRSEGWDPGTVLVNLGSNDSGQCDRDLQCARDAILHLVGAIGPGHRIWWPQVTRHPVMQHQADTWNLALRQIASERDDFHTWDWPAAMAAAELPSPDNTHLSPDGYRVRSRMMAVELTADVVSGSRTGGDATLPTPVGAPSEVVPIGPTRIIDTRIDPPGRVAGGATLQIDVSGEIPPGTTAIAAYVSATNTAGDGFLTAYECSAGRPEASSANHLVGETRGAVAITPVSATGVFCLYTRAEADLLVDLQAAFVPAGRGGVAFTPLDSPRRLVDTRETGRRKIVEVAVPAGARAAAVSITAIASAQPGYLVAYPCTDEVPLVATVNHLPGEVISGTAYVPVSADGTICVWSLNPVDLTIDLTGTFADDGELAFVPVPPTRMLDTRIGTGGWSPIHGEMQTVDVRVAPPEAAAVSGTLTIVRPYRGSFLRSWGCGPSTDTANVTSLPNGVLANSVTTGVDPNGRLCILARNATSSLFDTTGWWVPVP